MIQKFKTWREIRSLRRHYWSHHDMGFYARTMGSHEVAERQFFLRDEARDKIIALGGKV